MAAPHYAYNAMKIPGLGGIITIRGDPDHAVECETSGSRIADAVIAEEAEHSKETAQLVTDPNKITVLKMPNLTSSTVATSEPAKDTQRVDFVEGDPSNQAAIGPSPSTA